MRHFRTILMALLVAGASVGPALAERGRGDDRSFAGFQVSRATAVDIAKAHGMRDVREVKARKGVWKIEGFDADGRKMEIEIDGFSGAVVKLERYGR